ncbi:alpha/beta fold hydrolase [Pseudonocardia cypriaca]|uniref:Pimeloyl-ACP methyl ester carboxylesterase n=1 Tax=Pseudonocardia cypriaca TaxID=882449 RepID=A0A543FMY2_9PSEU|nr:alpha/beta hydrolase [Pseudonocardia cypriaca]TQM35195.1 pimeloyl-ACP methyl ester carboxylesterase [Pseudonocardia cypriaca]
MRRGQIWGAVAGAAGAAVTGVAVGVAAHKHSQVAAERRRLAAQLSEKPPQLAGLPVSEPSSVTADDGVRLSCEEIEAKDGNPALTVVLVHGFALDRGTWHFQRQSLPALSDPSIRVVLYDQRSHGRSERAPQESCTLEQLGHDLDAVIRALAPEGPLVLVGHSMGGMTIMAMAEQNPELFAERVVGVALISTSAGEVASGGLPGTLLSRHNPLTRGVGLLARLQPTLVETARKALGDVIWSLTRKFAYGDRHVAPWLVDLVDTMISTNAVDALIDFADTVNSHNRVAALPSLARCEVLVAAGTADRVIPATHSDVIAAELPDARLVHFDGVGHLPMLERPAEMDEALVDLIRRSADRVRPRRFRWRA